MNLPIRTIGWIVVFVLAAISIQQALERAKWKGVAEQLGRDAARADSAVQVKTQTVDSLKNEFARVDAENDARRRSDSTRVVRIERQLNEREQRADSLAEYIEANIDPVLVGRFREVIQLKDFQIDSLRSVVQIERDGRAAERERAGLLIVRVTELDALVKTQDVQIVTLESQVAALQRAVSPSLGVRLRADWYVGVAGVVVGAVAGHVLIH